MEKLKLLVPLYVVDCDLNVIVAEVSAPADRPWAGEARAKKKADEHARRTGHSVCVVRPTSWH